MNLAIERMRGDGCLAVDDINWSNGFLQVCVNRCLHPMPLTDNCKSNLSVRTGLIKLDHEYNGIPAITGGDENT